MRKFSSTFIALFLLIGLSIPGAQANVPEDFGGEYYLVVTPNVKNTPIPQSKALRVLGATFPNYPWPDNLNTNLANSACEIDFLDCETFSPLAPVTQSMFLEWWSHLQMPEIEFTNDKKRIQSTWYHMRSQGWLPILNGELSHLDLQTILYRYQVSQVHDQLPYRLGMTLSATEITTQNYPTIPEVDEALEALKIAKNQANSRNKEGIVPQLEEAEKRLTEVRQELYEAKHPFNVVQHEMPEDIKQKITDYGLNEVLAQTSYNYVGDNANRTYNVVQGLNEISGRIYAPGEEINYFDVLRENGLGDYRTSAILMGGRVVQGNGGGLCGSTTLLFRGALDSGLYHPGEEGTERYNHSTLYERMYPEGSIGKDAVTYFYSKTVAFKNHFDSPILFYAHNDSATGEVTLYIFGNQIYKDVHVSDAIKTGHNRYQVEQKLTLPDGSVETRYLNSYYPGGIR